MVKFRNIFTFASHLHDQYGCQLCLNGQKSLLRKSTNNLMLFEASFLLTFSPFLIGGCSLVCGILIYIFDKQHKWQILTFCIIVANSFSKDRLCRWPGVRIGENGQPDLWARGLVQHGGDQAAQVCQLLWGLALANCGHLHHIFFLLCPDMRWV